MRFLPILCLTMIWFSIGSCCGQAQTNRTSPLLPNELKETLRTIGDAKARGDFPAAASGFQTAHQQAGNSGKPEVEAAVSLKHAEFLETAARRATGTNAGYYDAVKQYREVLRLGNLQQQAVARNNLGTLLLRQEDYGAAIKVLQEININAATVEDRPVLAYNLGRAFELNHQPQTALTNYQFALRHNPRFLKAAEGVFRISLSREAPDVGRVAALARDLIEIGQTELPVKYLKESVRQFPDDAKGPEVLTELGRYYALVALPPLEFTNAELPFFKQIKFRVSSVPEMVRELEIAYAGVIRPQVEKEAYRSTFKAWGANPNRIAVISQILKGIGDYYSRPAALDPERALGCYWSSWALVPTNTEAALYAAAMLCDHSKAIEGSDRLLGWYIRQLFELKGNSYRIAYKNEQDWLNILRCHLVLGTIYERLEQWGDEGYASCAVFQFKHAADAENEILKLDRTFAPSPGLYERLANAYKHATTPKPTLAWQMYFQAAKGFLHYDDFAGALRALQMADNLGAVDVPADQKKAFEALRSIARDRSKSPLL